jgi:peptidoglycan hydrolase-like protein with peptidoglycan-binding domain
MRTEDVEPRTVVTPVGDVSAQELASRLRDLGYFDGPAEAQPWEVTVMALRKFQHDHGLPATGHPDRETMTIMRESYCY